MTVTRRHALLALAAAPAGCAIQQLAPLATQPMAAPGVAGVIRPPQVGQAWRYQKLNHFNSQVLAVVHETVASVGAVPKIAP